MQVLVASGDPEDSVMGVLAALYGAASIHVVDTIQQALARLGAAKFDLVLLDARLPGMAESAALRQIFERWPLLPVAVIGPAPDRTNIIAAVRNGARGYIPTAAEADVVREALRAIWAGELYIPVAALRRPDGR